MDYSDEDLDWALRNLNNPDKDISERAFKIVCAKLWASPYARSIVPAKWVDDVLQDVVLKFWSMRGRFEYKGIARFKSLGKLMILQSWLDLRRKMGLEDPSEVRDTGGWDVHEPNRDYLDKLCGEVWFGYPKDLPLAERNRRVLLFQLYYDKRQPWNVAWNLVYGRQPNTHDKALFESLLEDIPSLRDYAFRALYMDGPTIVRDILGLSRIPDLFSLIKQSRTDEPIANKNGWTNQQIHAIVWRYGYNFLLSQILALQDNHMTKEELTLLFERCESFLQFESQMLRLLELFGSRAKAIFQKQLVLKRLAYEMGRRDEVHLQDVHQRLHGIAKMVDYNLTMGILNMWICGDRLDGELGKGADDDE